MRRDFLKLLAAGLLVPRFAAAQQKHTYGLISPEQHISNPGMIEVTEFFWYGCRYCYQLEPFIESWLKKKPKDVAFVRIPALLDEDWVRDAVIYYTLDAMGLLDKLHRPLFDAIHRSALRTGNDTALNEWLEKNGVDPKKFKDVMTSGTIEAQVKGARRRTVGYGIKGTPQMAVQGKYSITTAQGLEGMLETVDYVVAMVRKEMNPAQSKGKKK